MGRWKQEDEEALQEAKRILKDELAARPQFPDVVGDRRLLRFLRGKSLKVDEGVKSIRAFFKWRDEHKVDEIRQDILYGGKNSPFKFPFGELILGVAPQIIISANALDKKGRPLAMETFDFSPKDMFEAVTIKEYLHFLIYTLEYRALVLEQMSYEREQQYLKEHPNPEDREDGYGVMVMDYTIRDLKGVGIGHLGSKGRALVAAALEAALPNYPEFLDKCVIINVPWVFNTFWYFVKGFLDEITLAKVGLCGSNFMPLLLEDTTLESIPESLGGKFKLYNEPYEFDLSEGGPLHYPGAPPAPSKNGAEAASGSGAPASSAAAAGTTRSSLHSLFPDVDAPTTSEKLAPLLVPSTVGSTTGVRRPSMDNGNAAGASGGASAANSSTNSERFQKGRQVSVELMSVRVKRHLQQWAKNNPSKVVVTLVWLGLFTWLRYSGWLQIMVYPTIVYATIFNTHPIVKSVLSHFDVEGKWRGGGKK